MGRACIPAENVIITNFDKNMQDLPANVRTRPESSISFRNPNQGLCRFAGKEISATLSTQLNKGWRLSTLQALGFAKEKP
jgi:hypothetical protein